MSSDPKRWLDDDGPIDETRDLLRSVGNAEPLPGAHDAIWGSLAAKLAVPADGGGNAGPAEGPPPTGGAGDLASTSAAKGAPAVVGIAVGIVSAIALVLAIRGTRPERQPTATSPSVVLAPAPDAAQVASAPQLEVISVTALPNAADEAPERKPTAPATSTHAPGARLAPSTLSSTAPEGIDALLDERARLASARDAHRRGDDSGALAILDAARERYPNGVLVQEREVLAIEALAQSGDRDAASLRAKVFVKAFPDSPHASHVREFIR